MPTLEQLLEAYPEKVNVVFKNYPLSSHKFAFKSASASLAAQNQGKFWAFHDALFENYKALNDAKIEEIATGLELDLDKFNQEMKGAEIQKRVRKDLNDGNKAGVRGTPTIFVNGRKLKARGMQGFRKAIDRELENLEKKGETPDAK